MNLAHPLHAGGAVGARVDALLTLRFKGSRRRMMAGEREWIMS
jgi:hypothetical protein